MKQGQKMEAMLKVKHGGNPAFGFLLVDNPLHFYYQKLMAFLKQDAEAAAKDTLLPPEPAGTAPPDGEDPQPAPEGSKDSGAQGTGPTGTVKPLGGDSAASAPMVGQLAEVPGQQGGTGGQEGKPLAQSAGAGNDQEGAAGAGGQVKGKFKMPDPETLKTMEKLVKWVVKSGREFENKVREKQRGDPRFAFLLPWNQYNAYYTWYLEEAFKAQEALQAGGDPANPSNPPNPMNSATSPNPQLGGTSASQLPTQLPPQLSSQPLNQAKEPAPGDDRVPESAKSDAVEVKGAASAPQPPKAQPVNYDPHAVTVVKSITSFGGSDEEEEEEEEEEQLAEAEQKVEAKEEKPEPTEEAAVAPEADPLEPHLDPEKVEAFQAEVAEKQKAAIKDAVQKAARLQRAKLLAEKVAPEVEIKKIEEMRKARKDNDDDEEELRRRSRSKSDEKSRSRERSLKRRDRRSRSRSNGRKKKHRRHHHRSRSTSRDRNRRRSRSPRRSRSRSISGKRHKSSKRSRSRDRKRSRRSRSKSRDRHRRHSKRSKSRSPSIDLLRKKKSQSNGASKAAAEPTVEEQAASEPAGEKAETTTGGTASSVSEDLRSKVKAMLSSKLATS